MNNNCPIIHLIFNDTTNRQSGIPVMVQQTMEQFSRFMAENE